MSTLDLTGTPRQSREDSAGGFIGFARAVRKRWAVIVASTLLGTGLSAMYSRSAHKVYEAASLVEINPHAIQPMGEKGETDLDMGAGLYWDSREYYETQYKIITSDHVLGVVARDEGLANDPDFVGHPARSGPASVSDAVAVLRPHVTVDPVRNSRLVNIKVDDTDPKRARRLCEAITSAYIDQNLQTAITATSDAVVWLNGQVEHLKQELEQDEDALHRFKQENDLPSTSINEASNMLRVEMQELDTAVTHTRTRKQEMLAREAELSKVTNDNPDELPASELLTNPYLQSLRTQYQEAQKERIALTGAGKAENHPLVKGADAKIAETRAALLNEVANIKGAVQRDLAIVTHEEAGEAGLFEATKRRAVELNMKEIEYHRLDRARDEDEKLYSLLLERMKQADLVRMMKVNNIRAVDMPTEPTIPVRPRVPLNLSLGVLLGLLMGAGLALLGERLDTSVKTPEDLEQRLGLTFLGLLPELEEGKGAGREPSSARRAPKGNGASAPIELFVHSRPLSGMAEAARSIRTNLMFMSPDRPYKKLLVSSAAPAEGKTTVACSIATALAQGGRRVCIIDCDLRRPRLHRVFDRVGDAGVTNVLVGDVSLEDVVKPTRIDNLWCVPAGPTPPNPADMLHSERFRRLINDLGEQFDNVVIDSPPLVAVTDSAIISTLVDGTVFVVRAFHTSRNLVQQGLRALRDVDARVIGCVLNAVNLNRHEYGYYHYYYYKRDGYRATEVNDDGAENTAAPPN